MKILLVCAGGMSTGLLMKKMEKYWADRNKTVTINAVGLAEYEDMYESYDVILVAPQTRYKVDDIKEYTGKPTDVIDSTDYALANCANIMKQVEALAARR